MTLLDIIKQVEQKYGSFGKKEKSEEIVRLLRLNFPAVNHLNTSVLRNFVFNLLDYNTLPNEERFYPYGTLCKASTFTVPLKEDSLTVTASSNDIFKVCPSCKMLANVGDPICLGCGSLYPNCELEEEVVAHAIRALTYSEELTASNNKVIFRDDAEGFSVTERDVNKYLNDIDKYKPSV